MTGYEKIELSDQRNLFFSRNDENYPVSCIQTRLFHDLLAFQLTEYAFCGLKANDNISPGRRDYVLSNQLRTNCKNNVTNGPSFDWLGNKIRHP